MKLRVCCGHVASPHHTPIPLHRGADDSLVGCEERGGLRATASPVTRPQPSCLNSQQAGRSPFPTHMRSFTLRKLLFKFL